MPQKVDINFKVMDNGECKREFSGSYNYGETVEESIKMFGAEVVNSKFIASDKITLQNRLRNTCEKNPNLTDEQIQEMCNAHKPGVAAVRMAADPVAASIAQIKSITDPEAKKKAKEKLIKLLQEA